MLTIESIKDSYQVRAKRYDTTLASLRICTLGFITHFSFIFLFAHWGVMTLSYLNIGSSALWAWAIFEIKRGYTYRSIYIASFEILLHAIFAVSILGTESGFEIYLIPLAAWLAYHPNIKYSYSLIIGTVCILLWMFSHIYWNHESQYDLSESTLRSMFIVNACIAGFTIIFAIISARMLVENQRALLFEQAVKDKLTGLHNRHYLHAFIQANHEQIDNAFRAYSLIVIDIDHFKLINDTYGHDNGDNVLKTFASLILNSTRSNDVACRWGGEEFVIVLHQCSLEEATNKAEFLRAEIEKTTFDFGNEKVNFSASFGVTISLEDETFSEVISRADEHLYEAKNKGRNQVVAG